jgi:hypothetical protein
LPISLDNRLNSHFFCHCALRFLGHCESGLPLFMSTFANNLNAAKLLYNKELFKQ